MTKTTISFDKNSDSLSMNNRFEAIKIKPEPTVERDINDIKDNRLKNIASSAMNLSDIIPFD